MRLATAEKGLCDRYAIWLYVAAGVVVAGASVIVPAALRARTDRDAPERSSILVDGDRLLDEAKVMVAEDLVKQYEIVNRNGSDTEAYAQASLVAAAYLHAENETKYREWKAVERFHAERAGLAR